MSFSHPVGDNDPSVTNYQDDGIQGDKNAYTITGGPGISDTASLLPTPDTDAEGMGVPNSGFVFKPIETISTGILLIICMVCLFIVSTVLPIECEVDHRCHIKSLSLLLYLHCLFWGISLISDQGIQYQHIKIRRRGYLEFYSEMRLLSQLQFWIISTWSTLLLSVSTILHDYCKPDGTCSVSIPLKKSEYVMVCIGIELVILIPLLGIYLGKVWKFNSSMPFPDVLRNDEMTTLSEFSQNSLGHIDEEIYQRQAYLILYYKEQNAMLRKTVLDLNHQVYNRTRCTPNPI